MVKRKICSFALDSWLGVFIHIGRKLVDYLESEAIPLGKTHKTLRFIAQQSHPLLLDFSNESNDWRENCIMSALSSLQWGPCLKTCWITLSSINQTSITNRLMFAYVKHKIYALVVMEISCDDETDYILNVEWRSTFLLHNHDPEIKIEDWMKNDGLLTDEPVVVTIDLRMVSRNYIRLVFGPMLYVILMTQIGYIVANETDDNHEKLYWEHQMRLRDCLMSFAPDEFTLPCVSWTEWKRAITTVINENLLESL